MPVPSRPVPASSADGLMEFRARTPHRVLGFIAFLLSFALCMFGGAVLFVFNHGLLAVLLMFVGSSLSSFVGLATTRWLARKDYEAWRARRGDQPFTVEDDGDR